MAFGKKNLQIRLPTLTVTRNLVAYCELVHEAARKSCVHVHLSEFLHVKIRNVLQAWWYSCLEKEITNPDLSCTIADACLILTPFNLIKSVTKFRGNGSSVLKSSPHIYGGSIVKTGDRGGTVFKVLCYKSEGRRFDSRWCQWNFLLM